MVIGLWILKVFPKSIVIGFKTFKFYSNPLLFKKFSFYWFCYFIQIYGYWELNYLYFNS